MPLAGAKMKLVQRHASMNFNKYEVMKDVLHEIGIFTP